MSPETRVQSELRKIRATAREKYCAGNAGDYYDRKSFEKYALRGLLVAEAWSPSEVKELKAAIESASEVGD